MTTQVVVIDYGLGNLFSVRRALEHIGAVVDVTSDHQKIKKAERLILPGVGAFQKGMINLREKNLIEPILEYANKGRPFLGICLGMQMLFDTSSEFGESRGLGLLPGGVVEIPKKTADGNSLKVPSIGWNGLVKNNSWKETILEKTEEGESFYFVHSFMAVPKDNSDLLSYVNYGGHKISAAVRKNNIYGFQFHPERSGPRGLDLLGAFVSKA